MFVTEVLVECSHTCLSTYCVRLLLYHDRDSAWYSGDCVTQKPGNIYCLVLYQKSLPASDIKRHLVIFLILRFVLF